MTAEQRRKTSTPKETIGAPDAAPVTARKPRGGKASPRPAEAPRGRSSGRKMTWSRMQVVEIRVAVGPDGLPQVLADEAWMDPKGRSSNAI